MAGRFVTPYPQFLDATPEVRSGAKLFFYAAGTSTKLDTYSDRTLSTPNTNPVVLNSAGYPSVDIYLQDLDYKVVLAPSTDTDPPTNPVWTADYVNARDSKLIAKTLTGSGSPNGSVAGTAGSASILPDFYWDYTNSILYVCTTTGTSSTAVWTAVNASSSTAAVPSPQGRLTLTSGTPVLASDLTNADIVYYTPYVGNLVPIYNGSTMIPTEFSELTLTLTSSQASNTLYDVFVFNNSGVLTLVTGPAWSTSTAGSGARGTGASTTQLSRIKGVWTNTVSMTARNGASSYTVGAGLGTYLGSLYIDNSAGRVSCHVSYGQVRKWGVWNAYNRVPIVLQAGDATASWNYLTNTIRASNNASSNSLTVFTGLPEEMIDLTFIQSVQGGAVSAVSQVIATWNTGIGWNSTTAFSGQKSSQSLRIDGSSIDFLGTYTGVARYMATPTIGINVATCLEITTATNGSPSVNYQGGSDDMILTAVYRG